MKDLRSRLSFLRSALVEHGHLKTPISLHANMSHKLFRTTLSTYELVKTTQVNIVPSQCLRGCRNAPP